MNIKAKLGKTMKGFGVGDIGPVSLALGMGVIVCGVVALILANIKSNVTDGNATYILTKGLEAVADFADWFSIIVVVIAAVIILGLIFLLGGKKRGGD